MNKNILDELLEDNDVIMIDTCFALRDEFSQFIDNIEIDLMAHKKKIVVKNVVIAELYRHMGSTDDALRSKATNAVSTICMKRNIFNIDEKNISTEAILKAFADVEFITDFTKNRIKYRMALLTTDYKLGKDIIDLNNLESCYGKKVEVFTLNRFGYLEELIYKDEDAQYINENVHSKSQKNKTVTQDERKTDWKPILISSAISFTIGLVVDKYGKQIANVFVKAFA